jgi:hypothetical protein
MRVRRRRLLIAILALLALYFFVRYIPADLGPVSERGIQAYSKDRREDGLLRLLQLGSLLVTVPSRRRQRSTTSVVLSGSTACDLTSSHHEYHGTSSEQ